MLRDITWGDLIDAALNQLLNDSLVLVVRGRDQLPREVPLCKAPQPLDGHELRARNAVVD